MDPYSFIDRHNTSSLLIIGDHAGQFIPSHLNGLGLNEQDLNDHIAVDIGVSAAIDAWGDHLKCSSLKAHYSRLYIDLNRSLKDPTLISSISDKRLIEGNIGLSPASIRERVDTVYHPYHQFLEQMIEKIVAVHGRCHILSLHSFTPIWRGETRSLQLGLLHAKAPRWVEEIAHELRCRGFNAAMNKPYKGDLEGDCMNQHAVGKHTHVLLEVRNDLLQQHDWRINFIPSLDGIVNKMEEVENE